MSEGRATPTGEIIRGLLAKRGITRYALFLTQGEGKELPGGIESFSGFVLTSRGRVHGFWLDWDEVAGRYLLDPWYRVEDLSQFASDPEYQRARQLLDIDV